MGLVDPKKVGVSGILGRIDSVYLATHPNGVFARPSRARDYGIWSAISEIITGVPESRKPISIETGQQRMEVPLKKTCRPTSQSAVFNVSEYVPLPLLIEVGDSGRNRVFSSRSGALQHRAPRRKM